MKKKQLIVCGIIAFSAVYLNAFIDSDFTKLGTLIDFALSGMIATAFINMLWDIVFTSSGKKAE